MTMGQVLAWSDIFVWYLLLTNPWGSTDANRQPEVAQTYDDEASTARKLLSAGVAGDVWHMRKANEEDTELISQLESWERNRGRG
jgi:hypothetical protein